MNAWMSFWTVLLIVVGGLFTGLAVTVAIGGWFDLRALFRSLRGGEDPNDER